MLNRNIFTGCDGSLTLSDPQGFPAFGDYFDEDGSVGRVTGVTLQVSTEIRPFHELGRRMPKQLRAGNVWISGTVSRAYINGAMVRLMLGAYADTEETPDAEPGTFRSPTFTMKIMLDNLQPPGEEGNAILTVFGVSFHAWRFDLPEDDFVLEHLSFRAQRLEIKDNEVPQS